MCQDRQTQKDTDRNSLSPLPLIKLTIMAQKTLIVKMAKDSFEHSFSYGREIELSVVSHPFLSAWAGSIAAKCYGGSRLTRGNALLKN